MPETTICNYKDIVSGDVVHSWVHIGTVCQDVGLSVLAFDLAVKIEQSQPA